MTEFDLGSKKLAAICGPTAFTKETERLLKEVFEYKDDEVHLFEG